MGNNDIAQLTSALSSLLPVLKSFITEWPRLFFLKCPMTFRIIIY